jgi:hypothetical protein
MTDLEYFVESKRQSIRQDRRNAVYCKLAFFAFAFLALVVLVTGYIKGLLLSPVDYRLGPLGTFFPRLALLLSNLIGQYIPTLWRLLLICTPYPQIPWEWHSLASWLVTFLGLEWISIAFDKKRSRLLSNADKAEEILENQTVPLLLHARQTQAIDIGVAGDSNVVVVKAMNQINRLTKPEGDSWWLSPLITIFLGVVANLITRLI